MKVEVSVVIPVYNNAGSLEELTLRLIATLSAICQSYEVIYVNDGSRDTSLSVLRKLANVHPSIKVLSLSRNYGQHPAICAGFEHSRGEYTVLMDADLQDAPEGIETLIGKLKSSDADVVYSVRTSADKKLTSRLTSVAYHYVFSKIVNTKIPLNIGTFRAFNRKFLEAMLRFEESNILYGPLMFYMGFTSAYVELPYNERQHGKSSYTLAKRLKLAVNSLVSYTDIPHKASIWFGSSLLIASLLYGFLVVLQYLAFGSSLPSGSTLILLVLCLTLGSVMLSLGIIGSYVFRVYQEVLRRPRYLVQERINVSLSATGSEAAHV